MRVVDEAIDKFTPDEGDYVPASVVEEAVVWLEANDPEGLAAWLWEHRHAILNQHFGVRLRSRRASTMKRSRARAFGEASSAFAEGDAEPLSHFEVEYTVAEGGTVRRVADMTGADHRFVAGDYMGRANVNAMLAEFHRAVAKRVKGKRTADAMSEAAYESLYLSIAGNQAA